MENNDINNIFRLLDYETDEFDVDLSFDKDNDFIDPDYCFSNEENDNLDDILAFNSDSENYVETNINNDNHIVHPELDLNDDDLSPSTCKKRKSNKALWKRTITKKSRAEEKPHTSLRKKEIFSRSTGPDCKCKMNCFTNVIDSDKILLLSSFNNIGKKSLQDTFLGGLI